VGSDADIVVFNPDRKETISVKNPCTHHMKVDYSAYEGFEVQGFTEVVLSRGRVIVENDKLATKGGGNFIKRAHTGELLR
jgi:dihydropyrimidinase